MYSYSALAKERNPGSITAPDGFDMCELGRNAEIRYLDFSSAR